MNLRTIEVALLRRRILCDEAGEGSRPLLLLHGLSGHRRDFEQVLPDLAELGRTLAPDLAGHGGASRGEVPEGYDFPSLVEDLESLLDALQIDRVDLLGHSFGGMVALRFYLAHPERVASLTLMSTSCEAPDNLTTDVFVNTGAFLQREGMAKLQSVLEERGRADEKPLPDDASDEARDWSERYWEHHRLRHVEMDPVAYEALGVAMMDQQPVTGRLAEIECPSLVIIGNDDADFVRGSALLSAGLPRVTTRALPGVGHHPHQEVRARFLEIMREHLESVRAGAAAASG